MNGRMKNLPLWIKLSCKYWQEKSAREKTLGVALEVYEATLVFFYPCGYYGGCGQVSSTKTFRERRAQWNGFRILAGVATKIRGPQQKYLCQCQIFCGLSSKKNHHGPPLRHLCPVT